MGFVVGFIMVGWDLVLVFVSLVIVGFVVLPHVARLVVGWV